MISAELIEQYVNFGIFLVAATLAAVSYLAWRRERDRRMATVTVGYGLFATYGLIVALERVVVPAIPYATVELIEHGAAVLILFGLLTFFAAVTRD